MRRVILCFIFIFAIAVFAGCSGGENIGTTEQMEKPTAPVGTTVPKEAEITEPTATTIPEETTAPTSADPETEEERTIYHEQQGKLSVESTADTVIVYAVGVEDAEISADTYLEATVQGETLTYELGQWEYRAFREGGISLADLDGDGADEIVLIMTVTGNGGALAQVFSVDSGEISLLYELNDIPVELETIYKDGFLMTMENLAVGFSENVDISKEFGPENFDKNGKYMGDPSVHLRPVSSGFVDTASPDGIPVIVCKRSVYLALGNRLGTLMCTFQYNRETDTLEVVSLVLQEH